jgi:hypothetical protein
MRRGLADAMGRMAPRIECNAGAGEEMLGCGQKGGFGRVKKVPHLRNEMWGTRLFTAG